MRGRTTRWMNMKVNRRRETGVRRAGLATMLAAIGLLLAAQTTQASPIALNNPGFQTGDLSGWTTSVTANGSLGPAPLPGVMSFDVTGSGASDAAWFQVGEASYDGTQQGGSITQTFAAGAGFLSASADIAATAAQYDNLDAGVFSLLIDNNVLDTIDFGGISLNQVLRGTLSGTIPIGAGSHTISVLMTRPFINFPNFGSDRPLGYTPYQYVDNVSLDLQPVPEPATLPLLLLGTGLGALATQRRRKERA